jgi:hypothetical protein
MAYTAWSEAMNILFTFMKELMKVHPCISEVASRKQSGEDDPMGSRKDLRAVYMNMLEKYRSTESISVVNVIMRTLEMKQGANALHVHHKLIMEIKDELKKAGLKELSLDTMFALFSVVTWNRPNIIEWLRIIQQEEYMVEGGKMKALTIEQSVSMFVRTKEKGQENSKNIMAMNDDDIPSMKEKKKNRTRTPTNEYGGKEASESWTTKGNEGQDRTGTIQSAYMQPEESEFCKDNGLCFKQFKYGNCKWGESCKYSHDFKKEDKTA